jgi:hypothetical protein
VTHELLKPISKASETLPLWTWDRFLSLVALKASVKQPIYFGIPHKLFRCIPRIAGDLMRANVLDRRSTELWKETRAALTPAAPIPF